MSEQLLPKKTHRCDLLPHAMNGGKQQAIRRLLRAWRWSAAAVAAEQWRLFFDGKGFNKNHDPQLKHRKEIGRPRSEIARLLARRGGRDLAAEAELHSEIIKVKKNAGKRHKDPVVAAHPDFEDPLAAIKERLGTAKLQMVRYQVVGMLESFMANRANDFKMAVMKSSIDEETRHQLLTVNAWKAWYKDTPVRMKDTGEPVPEHVRRLALTIMRGIMRRHRKPSMRHINAVLDQRAVTWGPADTARGFGLWATITTVDRKTAKTFKSIHVPLLPYEHYRERPGRRCLGLQVNEADDGTITFGIVTETTEEFSGSREAYAAAKDVLGLDFGLRTMFATDDGDLFGRAWFEKLKAYDAEITALAKAAQKAGRKPRHDPAYKAAVRRLRGFVKTEIGRVLNRIVAVKRPKALALERLNFRSPDLSRQMNRILQNCGRSVIRAKLQDLFERFGITSDEVNPAYSSQECSACGYVDKRNRKQDTLKCLHCGHQAHADVDGARTVRSRRSRPIAQPHLTKAKVLDMLVTQFVERHPDGRVSTGAGPWQSNPYFAKVRRADQRPPDVVAAEPAL